jgi:hypothetical protein
MRFYARKSEVTQSPEPLVSRAHSSFPQRPRLTAIQLYPDRVTAFALSEIALLVSLMSADKDVCQLGAQGLRFLAQAERQTGAPINPGMSEEERSRRHPVYEQMGDPIVVVVGKSNGHCLNGFPTEFAQDVLNNKNAPESFCAASHIQPRLTLRSGRSVIGGGAHCASS